LRLNKKLVNFQGQHEKIKEHVLDDIVAVCGLGQFKMGNLDDIIKEANVHAVKAKAEETKAKSAEIKAKAEKTKARSRNPFRKEKANCTQV